MRSDPYGELPQRSEKYAAMATELHMGRKGISELWGFENFTNLHTLWLNNNHLRSLEGLEKNIRLLNLHCHGNRISFLNETLRHLKFLNNLTLNQNCLTDIDEVIEELRHLKNVQNLDLFENPITQEDNYRLRMIGELPWIQVLDKHEVTEEERKHAKKVLKKIHRAKNIMNMKKNVDFSEENAQETVEPIPELPSYLLSRLKRIIVNHRVFLEKSMLDCDPQKKGRIPSTDFLRICKQFGLLEDLSDDEVQAIVTRYTSSYHPLSESKTVKKRTDKLSLSHSASSGSIYKVYINYPEFCRDIQPDQLRTMRFDDWKMEPAPELSRATADLEKYVNRVVKKREAETILLKKQSLMSTNTMSSTATTGNTAAVATLGKMTGTRSATAPGTLTTTAFSTTLGSSISSGALAGPGGIDSWLSSVLRHTVKSIAKSKNISLVYNGTKVPMIEAQESLEKVLSTMRLHGREPSVSLKTVRSNLQQMANSEGQVDINTFCDVIGCAEVVHVKTPKGQESNISRKNSNRLQTPKIVWVEMTPEDLHNVEREKFAESMSYLDALLRSGKGVDTKGIMESTINSATVGTRLMASRELNPKPKAVPTPTEIISTAPAPRADVVILPRLLKKKSNDVANMSSSSSSNTAVPDEELCSNEEEIWRKQFLALGLTKHQLEFAIDRKKRSKTSKGVGVSSLSKSAANAFYGVRPKTQGEFSSTDHKSQWNTSTGTLLIANDTSSSTGN